MLPQTQHVVKFPHTSPVPVRILRCQSSRRTRWDYVERTDGQPFAASGEPTIWVQHRYVEVAPVPARRYELDDVTNAMHGIDTTGIDCAHTGQIHPSSYREEDTGGYVQTWQCMDCQCYLQPVLADDDDGYQLPL